MSSTAETGQDLILGRPLGRLAAGRVRHWSAWDASARRDALRLAGLAASVSVGLITMAVADNLARGGTSGAAPLFWAGMFVLWIPSTARILGRHASRSERIALLVMLGMALYVVYILYSPRYFDSFDELLHWRTAQDILRTGKVFNPNPGLPVSPLYPGLEIVTSALTKITGMSSFLVARILIGLARLIVILALYSLYERVSKSSWLASIATAVYFTNPEFLFFNTSFVYESLAVCLALVVLYAVARGRLARGKNRIGATVLVILPLAATAATHHVSSFILVLGLALLATVALALDTASSSRWLWGIALIGVGFVLLWLYLVAGQVINYLEPFVGGGVSEVIKLIKGEGASRSLFQSYVPQPTPLVDKVTSFEFAVVTVLAMFAGIIRSWRIRRVDTFVVTFAIASLAYPLSGILHFTSAGSYLAYRLYSFVFVPGAFCIAIALARRDVRKLTRAWTVVVAVIGASLLYGGAVVGNPAWIRLPGPYLVSADSRSIEPVGISAASWAGRFLAHNSRIETDRMNSVLMLSYGDQWPVTTISGAIDLSTIFFHSQLTPADVHLLHEAGVRYVELDYRLTRSLPWQGFYFDVSEPGSGAHRKPVPVGAFEKFDAAKSASRIFDNGDIVIFDVSKLTSDG